MYLFVFPIVETKAPYLYFAVSIDRQINIVWRNFGSDCFVVLIACIFKFLPTHQSVPIAVLFIFMYALAVFTGINSIHLNYDAYPIRLGAAEIFCKK